MNIKELVTALFDFTKTKPVEVQTISTKMYKGGEVNRPENCQAISFTNIGGMTCWVNENVLYTNGYYAVELAPGERDTTAYKVRFDTGGAGSPELQVNFKLIKQ